MPGVVGEVLGALARWPRSLGRPSGGRRVDVRPSASIKVARTAAPATDRKRAFLPTDSTRATRPRLQRRGERQSRIAAPAARGPAARTRAQRARGAPAPRSAESQTCRRATSAGSRMAVRLMAAPQLAARAARAPRSCVERRPRPQVRPSARGHAARPRARHRTPPPWAAAPRGRSAGSRRGWFAAAFDGADPCESVTTGTKGRAGSDPPHGRLAVVVASSSPGPKPLPALERSSHRSAFRLPPSGRSSRADFSVRHVLTALPYFASARHHVGHRVVQGREVSRMGGSPRQGGYPPNVVRRRNDVDNAPDGASNLAEAARRVATFGMAASHSASMLGAVKARGWRGQDAPAAPCCGAARP